jgi:hypothetical protein
MRIPQEMLVYPASIIQNQVSSFFMSIFMPIFIRLKSLNHDPLAISADAGYIPGIECVSFYEGLAGNTR